MFTIVYPVRSTADLHETFWLCFGVRRPGERNLLLRKEGMLFDKQRIMAVGYSFELVRVTLQAIETEEHRNV